MNTVNNSENVQDVVQDILSIRRSINAFHTSKEGKISETAFQTHMRLQQIALFLSGGMFIFELFTHDMITGNLLQPLPIAHANFFIALSIAAFLALCVSISYYSVARAAKKVGDNLNDYIRRNFNYLKNLSHVSDLGVKFVVIGMLLHIGQAQLIAPFLLVFTADYLLQGRFFTLRLRTSQILALATLFGAGVMFALRNPEVRWPLAWFFILTALSIKNLREMKRVED